MKSIRSLSRCICMLTSSLRVLSLPVAAIFVSYVASAQGVGGKSSSVGTTTCPARASLAELAALGSIYMGELHGTNEAPRLLECLVDYEVAAGVHPLAVSLELQSFARNTKSLVWSGQDGRSSKAMADVVDHLQNLEEDGKITLNFQLPNYPVPARVDEEIGTELRDLASKGRVIALGGNFHAQRRQVMLPGVSVKPAGSYMGEAIKNVLIDLSGPGEAWGCSSSCGLYKTKSYIANGRPGTIVSGKQFGYDYVYFVPPYTASAPKFPPVNQINSSRR